MKIAQISPLIESVPPKLYGGTERVISYLTEELVRQGHDVTLFASGDSVTAARLVPVAPVNLRAADMDHTALPYHVMQLDMLLERMDEFDIMHFHSDILHYAFGRLIQTPHLTTLHGRQDLPELGPLYRHFSDTPLISISDSQRMPIPWANWQATVYHGLPPDLYRFHAEAEPYFVFLGRISPEKRLDRAINIAKQCKRKLYVAAKVDYRDREYFDRDIKPLLNDSSIQFIGEVNEQQKRDLLGAASALLFPIDWPEPFGLVMIESFACGTPVIAYSHGSIPEIMEDGVTGYVVDNMDDAIAAAQRIDAIDRRGCRDVFERRFTVARMAESYLAAYRRLIRGESQALSLRNKSTSLHRIGALHG